MAFNKLKRTLLQHSTKIPGWHTSRKIVVIESDDWGSIRMPSREIYTKLLQRGIPVDQNHYLKYDSLASSDDLTALFETLKKFRDRNGNHPVITANTVTSNPDFDKIRTSGFEKYYPELFVETLKRYPGREKSFELWKQGMEDKIFFPQFHGREHLNVSRWMHSLQSHDFNTRLAFEYKMFDLSISDKKMGSCSYMDALRYDSEEEYNFIIQSLVEGLNQFESLFGFRSRSFIAPRYTWNSNIESHLKALGIDFLQGRSYQSIPKEDDVNKFKNKVHFLGEKNRFNQIYLTRNAFFEPSSSAKVDWVSRTFKEISIAFTWKKAVIICVHRVNFIGSIFEENRGNNLQKFESLLASILKKFPDIEFMTSIELGVQIK